VSEFDGGKSLSGGVQIGIHLNGPEQRITPLLLRRLRHLRHPLHPQKSHFNSLPPYIIHTYTHKHSLSLPAISLYANAMLCVGFCLLSQTTQGPFGNFTSGYLVPRGS